jgi:hypothetical protein
MNELPAWDEITISPSFTKLDQKQKRSVYQNYLKDLGQLNVWKGLAPNQKVQVARQMEIDSGLYKEEPRPSIIEPIKETAKEVWQRTKAAPEVALTLATGLLAYPISAVGELGALAVTTPETAKQYGEYLTEHYTWQPRGKEAQEAVQTAGPIISAPFIPAEKVGETVEKKYGTYWGIIAKRGTEALTMALMSYVGTAIKTLKSVTEANKFKSELKSVIDQKPTPEAKIETVRTIVEKVNKEKVKSPMKVIAEEKVVKPTPKVESIAKEIPKPPMEPGKLEGTIVYRGGETTLDYLKGTKEGISVSTKKEIAEIFMSPEGGIVSEALLPKGAKILKESEIPKNMQNAYINEAQKLASMGMDLSISDVAFENLRKSVLSKQRTIVNYARSKGYDAVDFPFENEIRIIKPGVLKEVPKPPVQPGKVVPKEPWEMTREEFNKSLPVEKENLYVYFSNHLPSRNLRSDKPVTGGKEPGLSVFDVSENVEGEFRIGGGYAEEYLPAFIKNRKAWLVKGDFAGIGSDGETTLKNTKIIAQIHPIEGERDWFRLGEHKDVIEQAISEGKSVPPEVLKDYPDLIPNSPLEPGKIGELGKIDEVIAKNKDEVVQSRIQESQKGQLTIGRKPKEPSIKTGVLEVDAVLNTTKGSFIANQKDKILNSVNKFNKTTQFEYVIKDFPGLVDDFRLFQTERRASIGKAFDALDGVLGKLKTRNEYKVFNQAVVLEDFAERSSKGLTVPGNLTLDQINIAKSGIAKQITPEIQNAVNKHLELVGAMRDDLVSHGKIGEDQGFTNYYPHVVLDYLWNKEAQIVTPKKGKVPYRGYTKEAYGSAREIQTDYLDAMTKRLSQYFYDNAKEDFIRNTVAKYDQTEKLFSQIKTKYKFSEDRKLMPGEVFEINNKRYKTFQPETGNYVYPATTITEKAIGKVVSGQVDIEDIKLGEALAIGRKKPIYLLDEAIANRLEKFSSSPSELEILRTLNKLTSKWKGLTIDFGGTAWNLINLSGDFINLYRVDPAAFSKLPKALIELSKQKWFGGSDLIRLADKLDVTTSGYIKSDAPLSQQEFLRFSSDLQQLYGGTIGKTREFWRDVLDLRESTPRVAAFFQNLERIQKGETLKTIDFPPEVIKALSKERLSAKSAREFTVDYGKFTPEENSMMRGLLFPFYSWTRQNVPNWAKYAIKHPLGLAIKFGIFYEAIEVWNNSMYSDIEKNLTKYQRNTTHIITGYKDKDGKDIILSIKGDPLKDAMEVVGLGGTISRLSDLITQRINLSTATKDQLTDIVMSLPTRTGQLLTPFIKAPIEAVGDVSMLTGTPLYPEEFRGTTEATKEGIKNIIESLIRPLREYETITDTLKRGEFDPLTFRYLGGLPLTKVDLEGNKFKKLESDYYSLLNKLINQGMIELEELDFYKKLPKIEQNRWKGYTINKIKTNFMSKYPPPASRKEKMVKGLIESIK